MTNGPGYIVEIVRYECSACTKVLFIICYLDQYYVSLPESPLSHALPKSTTSGAL